MRKFCVCRTKMTKNRRMEKLPGLINYGLTLVNERILFDPLPAEMGLAYFRTFRRTISIRVLLTFRISNS